MPLLFSKAEAVIGCGSTLMAISVLSNIKTFCAIPPGGKKNNLPFKKNKIFESIRMINTSIIGLGKIGFKYDLENKKKYKKSFYSVNKT